MTSQQMSRPTRREKAARSSLLSCLAFGLALGLAVSGCGPLVSLGNDGKPPTLYTLTAPATGTEAQPQLPVTLVVAEPSASDAIDSRRIALMPAELEIRYYSGVRWTDRAPRMVQAMLVENFTGQVINVTADSMPMTPDYRLVSRLVSFETRYPRKKHPVAKVALELQLYSTRPLALVATTRIEQEQPASADKSGPISRAFNAATQETVKAATAWAYAEMSKQKMIEAK